jgi:hypothetical protein
MGALMLDSLVLQVVSVVDGQNDGLRLGSYEARLQAKAIPFSRRHPSFDCRPTVHRDGQRPLPAGHPEGKAVLWSGSRAGVLDGRSPAVNAGRTSARRWFPTMGGPRSMAAAPQCPKWVEVPASVADVNPRGSSCPEASTRRSRERFQATAAPRTTPVAST